MFIAFVMAIVVFLIFLFIFVEVMGLNEGGGFFMALIAGFLAGLFWAIDSPTINLEPLQTVTQEVNVTALQNVVDLFDKRIDVLENKNCTCEPVMVTSPPEIVDTYGTGY